MTLNIIFITNFRFHDVPLGFWNPDQQTIGENMNKKKGKKKSAKVMKQGTKSKKAAYKTKKVTK